MSDSDTDTKIAPVRAQGDLTLRDFDEANPRVWFRQVESAFYTRQISSQRTKYHLVLAKIPTAIVADIEDVLDGIETHEECPYDCLKEVVLKRRGKSKAKAITEVLRNVQLGDRTPSQLLRHMLSLLGGCKCDEELLRALWLERLPQYVQPFLAAIADDFTLTLLADKADKIMESSSMPSVSQVASSATDSFPRAELKPSSSTDVSDLTRCVDRLITRLDRLESRYDRAPRSRSRSTSRSRTPARRPSSKPRPSGLCWYHWRFGRTANNCTKPCNFSSGLNMQASK